MYSRRNILKAMGLSVIFPGIAIVEEIEKNNEWNKIIKRGIKRNVIVVDSAAKSETFLYPQKINKRYEWNYNLTRRLVALMKTVSRRSYAATNPGVSALENPGVITDLYVSPVYYNEFVDRIKNTRALSKALNVKIIENDVYFLNVHIHPLVELDNVPADLMEKAQLKIPEKGILVIGLSKKLDPSHEKYILLGAI